MGDSHNSDIDRTAQGCTCEINSGGRHEAGGALRKLGEQRRELRLELLVHGGEALPLHVQ